MASLIDVFGRLLLEDDGRKFVTSAVKAGEKAGDQAGQSMGKRLATGIKQNFAVGARAAAGVATLAFGVATKGALEMEDAMARYRAETGATAEEAKRAIGAVNRIAGDQQQALETVADTAIRVKRDLGATGEEADRLTEHFTKLARVTKQDAAQAVMDYDDILDAWGLTAADAVMVSDKLLVSQQKYGGSITENQQALAKMAPALQALNADIDDGIGLLNLFAASGLDAGQAQAALNRAVKELEPGQTLDDLVASITSIEDPTLRAQRAIEVFGSRGGVGLSNALKPGVDSLADFGITAEEAAGQVTESTDALDSSLGARFRKMLSQAGAAVRGFGSELGPALTGLASLASLGGAVGLDRGIAKAFGKLAGSALIKGAASKAGLAVGLIFSTAMFAADKIAAGLSTALNALPGSGLVKGAAKSVGGLLGTTLGKFAAAGLAAFLVVEVVNVYNDVKRQLESQNAEISKNVSSQIATGTTASLEQTKAALQQGLTEINGVWDAGLFTTGTRQKLEADMAAVDAELARRAAAMPGHVGSELAAGAPEVEAGADAMVDPITGELVEENAAAAAEAAKTPQEIAAGILSTQGEVGTAMAALTNQIENEKTRAQEIAYLIGVLTSEELANGLRDKRPGVRAQAEATREIAEKRLAELQPASGNIGKRSNEALASGMKSKDPAVRAQAQRTSGIVERNIKPNTRPAGRAAISTFVQQLNAGRGSVGTAANRLAQRLISNIVATVRASSGVTRSGPLERQHGGRVYPGQAYVVGEVRPELFVPDVPGTIVPRLPAASEPSTFMGAGETHYEINVPVQGALPVRTIRDLTGELRRLAEKGALPSPTATPQYRVRGARAW